MAGSTGLPPTTPNYFPFLKLPAELRVSIYEHAFGPELYVEGYVYGPQVHPSRRKWARECRLKGPAALLRVSRQNRKNLRIRLDFDEEEFLNFFVEKASTGLSKVLRLRTLSIKSLKLCFLQPWEYEFVCIGDGFDELYDYAGHDFDRTCEKVMREIREGANLLTDCIPIIEIWSYSREEEEWSLVETGEGLQDRRGNKTQEQQVIQTRSS